MSHVRMVTIVEESRSGVTRARIVEVDDRIIIDEYEGPMSGVKWYCDNCEVGQPVTAQFKVSENEYITLCRRCCENAANGIAYSYANPVKSDGAANPESYIDARGPLSPEMEALHAKIWSSPDPYCVHALRHCPKADGNPLCCLARERDGAA